ncbi:MAG: shikimate kinase [Proteobacteria bacterium]|nr:shikimate kinase [Pseudomonadota bacterium]
MQTLGKSVVLIGHMGAGKSSLGPALAHALNLPFIDCDARIEEEAGQTIADIFKTQGEERFRQLEYTLLRQVLAGTPAVIATGGGMFMAEACRELIRTHAISLWLRASVATLAQRLKNSMGGKKHNPRPLLAGGGEVMASLTQLAKTRDPIYATADIIVDIDGCSRSEALGRVLAALAPNKSQSESQSESQNDSQSPQSHTQRVACS